MIAFQKSNPLLYEYLDNLPINIYFYSENNLHILVGDKKIKLDGLPDTNPSLNVTNKKLQVDGIVRSENYSVGLFRLEEYINSARIGVPLSVKQLSRDEVETYFKDNFVPYETINVFIGSKLDNEMTRKTMAHEAGHVVYAILHRYLNWLWGQVGDPENSGHEFYNESGKWAKYFQNGGDYDFNKYKKE